MTMLEIILAYISPSFAAKCRLRLIKKIENTKRQKIKQRKSIFRARSFIRCDVMFRFRVRLFPREGGGGSLHPIRGLSNIIGRRVFFFLKSTFGVLFESGSTSPVLLFRSPFVIAGSEFCIRTPFLLIEPGCSGIRGLGFSGSEFSWHPFGCLENSDPSETR